MAGAPVLETIVSYYVETKLLRNLPSIFTGCLNVKLVLTFLIFWYKDETKMDHVLQQTEKSRQMANHIAYTTFAAHGVNNGIFPVGPEVCLHNTPSRPRN